MKVKNLLYLLALVVGFSAQAQSKSQKKVIQNTGFECGNYTNKKAMMLALRSGDKLCVGWARCWQKSKCPKRGPNCTAFYGKENFLFCRPEKGKCVSSTKCVNQKGAQIVTGGREFAFK